jgi:hypothetical protein
MLHEHRTYGRNVALLGDFATSYHVSLLVICQEHGESNGVLYAPNRSWH